jgi:hydroxyacylglutathione hydrolase
MEKINDVVFIEGRGYDSNIYLIGDIIIDTGTGENAKHVFSEILKSGISPEDISTIINTHCHFDHTGGNSLFSADIMIHEEDADALEKGDSMATVAYMFGKSTEPEKIAKRLQEGDKISDFEVIHTPGHTRGGICLFDGEILISGDTVFANGGIGRMDIGGSYEDMINSLEKLQNLNAEYLLPGHGPWTNNAHQHINMSYQMAKRF